MDQLRDGGVEDYLQGTSAEFSTSTPTYTFFFAGFSRLHPLRLRLADDFQVDDSVEDEFVEELEWFQDGRREDVQAKVHSILSQHSANQDCEFVARYAFSAMPHCVIDGKRTQRSLGDISYKAHGSSVRWQQPVVPMGLCATTNISPTSVELEWDVPEKCSGFRIEYTCIKDEHDQATPYDETKAVISRESRTILKGLEPSNTYEIVVRSLQMGYSQPSDKLLVRTPPSPSLVSEIVRFYQQNAHDLDHGPASTRPWKLDKNSLYVGLRSIDSRFSTEYQERVLEIMEVMPEYQPDIEFGRDEDACVILLTGRTGDGKSTHINALFNWLCRIDQKDQYRLMIIDESGLRSNGIRNQRHHRL